MKQHIFTQHKYTAYIVLCIAVVFANGCSSDLEDGYYDDKYLVNMDVVISHPNPDTDQPYTQEELDSLTYNPQERESYLEGQTVDLTVVSAMMPSEVVVSAEDGSVIETINDFTQSANKYHAKSFITSLEELGLMEAGDNTTLSFTVKYNEGPSNVVTFDVRRIAEQVEQDTFYVFLKQSGGETTGLATVEEVTSNEEDPERGAILTFNGESDRVEVVDVPELSFRGTEDFSVGVWVNTTSDLSDPAIISDKDWGDGYNPGFVFSYTGGTWKLNAGDGSNRIDINGLGPVNDGEWHFLMVTFDRDGNATAYQDGVEVGNADMSGIGDMSSELPIYLGQDGTGEYSYGYWYEGLLGQSFIFDYALSPEQVADLYGTEIPTGVQLQRENGLSTYIPVTSEGGTTTETEQGRTTFTFDGGDDLVTWDDPSDLEFRYTEDFSVAVWVNTISDVSDPAIISDKDWGSGGNKGFVLPFKGGSWGVNAGDGDGNRIDLNGNAINDGEWHLLAATFDRDGNLTLYEDGVEVDSGDMSVIGDMNSGYPIRLGQDGTGTYGYWFEGKVANSMIFDYVLSPAQVEGLYNE